MTDRWLCDVWRALDASLVGGKWPREIYPDNRVLRLVFVIGLCESDMAALFQRPAGPGRSLWQLEQSTVNDVLRAHRDKFDGIADLDALNRLEGGDLFLAARLARIKLWFSKNKLSERTEDSVDHWLFYNGGGAASEMTDKALHDLWARHCATMRVVERRMTGK